MRRTISLPVLSAAGLAAFVAPAHAGTTGVAPLAVFYASDSERLLTVLDMG